MNFRFIFFIAIIFSSIIADAQEITSTNNFKKRIIDTSAYHSDTLQQFFDLNWLPCLPLQGRYFTCAYKEGNLWRAQEYYVQEKQIIMDGTYTDAALKQEEGQFLYFNTDGNVKCSGKYFNGEKLGWWLSYDEKGNNSDSTFYLKGLPAGRCISRHSSGNIYEIRMMDRKGNGTGTYTSFYESGQLIQSGIFTDSMKKDSTWVYYHENGKPSFIQQFKSGNLLNQKCYDTSGTLLKKCLDESMPEYPGGIKKLLRYLSTKINFPDKLKLNMPYAYVVAQFVINKDGQVEDAKIVQPLHPEFDKEVLRAINKMPLWKPGIQYNKPVRVYYTLPVKFQNPS